MAIFSSISNLFSSKKPTQQAGFVNGQPIASFYTPQASTVQPPKPVSAPMPQAKPIVATAPKPITPLPTATPTPNLSIAQLLNNTQNAYRDSGLVPSMPQFPPTQTAAPVAQTLQAPQEDPLKSFREEIIKNLTPTDTENQLQSDYNNVINSRDLGIAEYRNRPVPMQIITGQTQALNEQAGIKASTLKDKLALEQARRQAGLEVSKFGYEAAKDKAALDKPTEIGGNLVKLNPATGKYESVYSAPQENKPIEVNGQLIQLDPTTGQYKSVFGSPKEDHSPIYKEWQDAVNSGYKGGFIQYQNEDQNRKRPVTNVNVGGSGMSSGQITAFNSIVGKYNASPLVQAADRTPVLTATIEQVKKNPGNAALQLNLSYAYIQALDTYQSAVREGELGLVNSIDSKVGQFQNSIQQIQNGQIVRPEIALQIANAASNIVTTIKQAAQAKAQSFQSQATTVGLGSQWTQYVSGFNPSYGSTSSGNPSSELEDDIKQLGSRYGTRELLIADLQKSYPEFNRDQIASKVYTLIPDKR